MGLLTLQCLLPMTRKFAIVEAGSARNFPAEPVTGKAQYSTGDVYFCRGSLVGSQAAGTVAQAREVSDNMRDIPEVRHGKMDTVWACVMCDVYVNKCVA